MKTETGFESGKLELGSGQIPRTVQKRALVIDDEPAMCDLILEVLRGVDIEGVPLDDSSEIHSYFQKEKFDLVIVDLERPGTRGDELVREIRSSGLNRITPVILFSRDQRPVALARGFEAGATFFAYKPIDRPHLMQLIRATQGAIEREKRRFRRVPIQAKVRIKSDKMELEGETIDISLNGALIAAPHTIPVGSLVEISLYLLAGNKPVVGLGTIVRVLSGNRMGILIDRLPPIESGRLQEYLLPRIEERVRTKEST
jgi:CheY-like chemotaxis protein